MTYEQPWEQPSNAFIQGGLYRLKIGLGRERYELIKSLGLQSNFFTFLEVVLFNVYN